MKFFTIIAVALFVWACDPAASNESPKNTANSNVASSPTPVAGQKASSETVTIETPDGVKLIGTFYKAKEASSPAVLLLHQWTANRHTYDEFAERLNQNGYGVLSIDGRGFGESVKKADGSTVKVDLNKGLDPKAIVGDARSAVEFLSKQPNVDANKIGIVGASYGSSVAMIYGAEDPKIAAVVLLSPGINYFNNLPTLPAIKKYGKRPILLVAAEDDKDSAAAVRELKEASANPNAQVMVYSDGGHGTFIFDHKDPKDSAASPLGDLTQKFLDSALKPTESPKPQN